MKVLFCPHCGFKNEEDDIYCANCGKRIHETFTNTQTDKNMPNRRNHTSVILMCIVVMVIVLAGVYYLTQDGTAILDSLTRIIGDESNANNAYDSASDGMSDVSRYINGFNISVPSDGDKPYYNFEKNFSFDSYDYKVIELFSDLRNDILRTTYESKGDKAVKSKIRDVYFMIAETICLDKRLSWQERSLVIDYSELSNQGKRALLELAQAVLSIDLSYELDLNGEYYFYKEDLNREVRNKLKEVAY